jgi:hypothetical protein
MWIIKNFCPLVWGLRMSYSTLLSYKEIDRKKKMWIIRYQFSLDLTFTKELYFLLFHSLTVTFK